MLEFWRKTDEYARVAAERCCALPVRANQSFRRCEERSDEAIQLVLIQLVVRSWIASLRSQ